MKFLSLTILNLSTSIINSKRIKTTLIIMLTTFVKTKFFFALAMPALKFKSIFPVIKVMARFACPSIKELVDRKKEVKQIAIKRLQTTEKLTSFSTDISSVET